MTREELKKELKEILELVKLCPQEVQPKCFEMLLADALAHREAGAPKVKAQEVGGGAASKEGLQMPVEIRKRMESFAAQHGLSLAQMLKVYSVDEFGNVSIEATDLKVSKTAKQQRRLALLAGGKHQFMEGSFDVPVEELRELCVTYSAYDPANFMKTLKGSKELFAGFKADSTNKLSPKGKSELGALIKELAS